jgi:HEAT repeat protein
MSPLRVSPAVPGAPGADRRTVERTVEGLLGQLEHADAEVRRRAVLDLADRPEAWSALVDRVGHEPDPTVRSAICTQLARHDVPAVVDGLVRYLASDHAAVRNAVAGVLARTPVSTARRMPDLLADPDPDVRILTVTVLGALRTPDVEDWLAGLVSDDPHPNVVSTAIGELVSIAGDRCRPALLAARERFPDDPFIAFTVDRALQATSRAGS